MLTATRCFWFAWLAVLGAALVVGLLPQFSPPGAYEADKFIHAFVFLALALPPCVLARTKGGRWGALLLVGLLGLGIEIGQTLVPGRTGSAFDFAADVTGIGMAATLGAALRRRSFPGILRRAR